MKINGILSAKAACILSYWAKRGGLVSPGDALAVSPKRTGGAFSTHFDRVLGLDATLRQNWYMVDIPGHCKHDFSRTIKQVAVRPAHESLAEEVAGAPVLLQHPLTLELGPHGLVPIGIYIDGVQYQRRNSTIGFWCINLATERRHLMAVLQKRDLCRCGCRGYCSLFPIMSFIEWSIAAAVAGVYPVPRHDGEWRAAAPQRAFAG